MTQPASKRLLTEDRAVALAQAGQTPPQEPVAPGTRSVGSLGVAARANHVHPTNGELALWGFPPSYPVDYHFDGAWSGTVAAGTHDKYNGVGDNYGIASRSGSAYTTSSASLSLKARDITIDAGVTLKGTNPGGGLLIVCSGTFTLAGTIDCSGESPAAGAAPTQGAFNGSGYSGNGGATGGTGVGGVGVGTGSVFWMPGGEGGAGGASGATAGGSNAVPDRSGTPWPGLDGWMYLVGTRSAPRQNSTSPGTAGGGHGGASGAGDGTNKGGSGGGGGGVVVIVARKIVITSTAVIKARGGNGAPGAGGNAGGGGGGGGGVISLQTLDLTIDPAASLQTQAGVGGAGSGTGATGVAGNQSWWVSDPPVSPTSFGRGYGSGVLINVWG